MTSATSTISYTELATPAVVERTKAAIEARGIKVHLVNSGAQALQKIHELIPAGSEVMTGGSQTLHEIGLEDQLKSKDHPWVNLKDTILAENNPEKQGRLRIQSTMAQYYLGSVHGISESGEIVIASGSGSQLPAYAFSSRNVIWVAGTQKIVPSLDEALKRTREYVLPREADRWAKMGRDGLMITKILIVEAEPAMLQRNINLVLINESLGF